ncbi:MAG: sigma-70 family RNA polymerase sigma factor [Myxococcota bacterium]
MGERADAVGAPLRDSAGRGPRTDPNSRVGPAPVPPRSITRATGDPSTSFGRPQSALSAADEVLIGRQIRDAERKVWAALRELPQVAPILGRATSGRYRTHAGWVDKLEEALALVVEASREDSSLKAPARAALAAWNVADQLRWRLAMSQHRIAFHEARKLAGRMMDRADLTQEGYLGLLRAAKRFDPERGLRFSTYARWWVRAQITRTIDQSGRVVRLPGAAVEQLRNLRKAQLDHERLGAEWTIPEIAAEAGVDPDRAEFLLSRGDAVSLDEPVDDNGNRALGVMLADEDAVDALDDSIHRDEARLAIAAVEQELDERQRIVLQSRYGLHGEPPLSLAEVGRRLSLSRERVRQLEKEALRRLRDHGQIREIA